MSCQECENLKREIVNLKIKISEQQENESVTKEMDSYYNTSATGLSLRRLPALTITLGLELVGGIIIDQLHRVIKIYTLISSFMPAISALSGNLGLQASSNTIRGLGTGQSSPCFNYNTKVSLFQATSVLTNTCPTL